MPTSVVRKRKKKKKKGVRRPLLDQTVEYDGRGRRIEKVETNSGQAKVPG